MKRKSSGVRPTPQRADSHVVSVAAQLAELESMSTGQLQEKWGEVFGEAPRSRNKAYLQKRLAYRLQEIAEGGLSAQCLARIDELSEKAPIRRRGRSAGSMPAKSPELKEVPERDPRLPPIGVELVKNHKGEEHRVLCRADGFEWQGTVYKSLSKVAKAITGTSWNGYLFFGLLAVDTKKGGER